jgi:proteasome activator subunit 4
VNHSHCVCRLTHYRPYSHVPKELIERPKPFAAGVPFSDPKIAQYQELQAYRARFGRILHQAVGVFKAEKEDSSIDAVRLTIRSIGTFLTAYGVEQKAYANLWKAYSYVEKQAKVWNRQKSMPRHLWIQRMEIYHAARLRLNAQRRGRSGLDDDLIKDLVSLAISPFVKTRQIAQATLTSACALYDGVFPMIIPLLLPSLERGVDPDVMKGALYTLGSSTLRQTAVADARFLNPYILTLLRAQHQEKPTIQSLVGAVLDKAVTLLNEPMTLQQGRGPKLAIAIERLLSGLSAGSSDVDLRQRATLGVTESKAFRDKAYLELIPQVLAIAQDPATHWKYTVTAARLLKNLLRRDMATSGAVAEYFVSKIPDTQPALCAHARLATTRLLYLIKLRTLCQGSEEALFLQNGKNPLKRSIRPEVLGDNFTKNYLDSFRIPVDDKSEEDQWMQDKSSAGWLCWGENIIQSRLAKWDENPFQWESDSSEAIEAMRKYVDDPAWWKSVAENWAQEKTRTHLSADNIDVLRSFCQIYQDLPFKHLQPVMEVYLDTADKDKQRALAELLAGLLRGMKHWPGKMRAGLWEWLTPRLPKIYSGVRPDTFKYWSGFFEHTLYQRDPRRMQPMVDYLLEVGQSVDYTQDSAFELKKATALSSSLMRCLAWRFEPWADDFVKLYFGPAISSDYVDIRNLVGGNIMLLDNVRWHPSYPSPRAFLEDCLQNPEKDIMGTKGHLGEEMKRLIEMFPKWREERPSGPSASLSTYDKTGSTVARWLYTGLSDTHAPAVFSYVLPIL